MIRSCKADLSPARSTLTTPFKVSWYALDSSLSYCKAVRQRMSRVRLTTHRVSSCSHIWHGRRWPAHFVFLNFVRFVQPTQCAENMVSYKLHMLQISFCLGRSLNYTDAYPLSLTSVSFGRIGNLRAETFDSRGEVRRRTGSRFNESPGK